MTAVVVALVVLIVPTLGLVALFQVVERVRRVRQEAVAAQVAVTDAIHRELGGVVAPTVRQRLRGRWQLCIAVPFGQPRVVAAILSIAHGALSAPDSPSQRRFEIVLTPGAERSRRLPRKAGARPPAAMPPAWTPRATAG